MIIKTTKKQEMIDITARVQKALTKTGVKNGLCHVFARHTSCAIMINENWDPNISVDIVAVLNKIIPAGKGYLHDRVDNNFDAHMKSVLLGPEKTVPVQKGKLVLGQWQAIMLAEFDGPREREIIVTAVPQ